MANDAIEAARKALEAAQRQAEADMQAAALAEQRATQARDRAESARQKQREAEAEALRQERTGRGNNWRAAVAAAKAASEQAAEAVQAAERASADALAARTRVEAANQRASQAGAKISDVEAQLRKDALAAEQARNTLIAIGAGAGVSAALVAATKVLENRDNRKLVEALGEQVAKAAAATSPDAKAAAVAKITAGLDALKKTGALKPLGYGTVVAKAVVGGGTAAALMGTSLYLKQVAAKQRELGNETVAGYIDTIALAEQYAAVGIAAKTAVGVGYTALEKVGKPKLRPPHLAVIAEAKAVKKAAAAPKAQAPAQPTAPTGPTQPTGPTPPTKQKGPPKPGTVGDLKLQAKAAGIDIKDMKKADLQAALAAAKANAPPPPAMPAGGAATGWSALRAASRAIVPVVAGVAAVAAYTESASAGESTGTAVAKAGKVGATTAVDLASGGMVSSFNQAQDAGVSTLPAAVSAVARGTGALLTMGASEIIAAGVRSQPRIAYTPDSVKRRGRAFLNAGAESRSGAVRTPTLARMQQGAGWRNGRGFANKAVQAAAQAARRRKGK